MHIERCHWIRWSLAPLAVVASVLSLSAQPPAGPATSAVLTNLTIKSDADRAQIGKVMPDEVRETVKLYLDGKIQQWYARSDGRGVVFIMNCGTVDETKALMESLPLAKAKLVNLDYTPMGPLTPLRLLLAAPVASSKRLDPQP